MIPLAESFLSSVLGSYGVLYTGDFTVVSDDYAVYRSHSQNIILSVSVDVIKNRFKISETVFDSEMKPVSSLVLDEGFINFDDNGNSVINTHFIISSGKHLNDFNLLKKESNKV